MFELLVPLAAASVAAAVGAALWNRYLTRNERKRQVRTWGRDDTEVRRLRDL